MTIHYLLSDSNQFRKQANKQKNNKIKHRKDYFHFVHNLAHSTLQMLIGTSFFHHPLYIFYKRFLEGGNYPSSHVKFTSNGRS